MTYSRLLLFAAAIAAPAAAQRADAPLGELLEVLEEAPPVRQEAPPPRRVGLPPSGIATTELPPSRVSAPAADPEQDEFAIETVAEEPLNPWEAERERRRAEVNMLEAPLTSNLNLEIAARHAEVMRANDEAREAHRRALDEYRAETARREAEHRDALERHEREVARQRAAYQRAVAACMAGDLAACGPPPIRR